MLVLSPDGRTDGQTDRQTHTHTHTDVCFRPGMYVCVCEYLYVRMYTYRYAHHTRAHVDIHADTWV